MAHLKRQAVPKNWPVPRKGTTYLVKPRIGKEYGIPVLVVLRDLLKVAKTKKEVKKALNQRFILVNGKEVRDEKKSILLFDTLSLIPSKKHYRLNLSKAGKFKLEEIKETETKNKVAKVINKKILKGKKVQINLSDGRNFLSDIKCNINDSVLIDLEKKKVEKCLPLKSKSKVVVFQGKHAGEVGIIEKVDEERKMVKISEKEKSIKVLIKQVIVKE
jgi:small subunit ribosomal protein S4e